MNVEQLKGASLLHGMISICTSIKFKNGGI